MAELELLVGPGRSFQLHCGLQFVGCCSTTTISCCLQDQGHTQHVDIRMMNSTDTRRKDVDPARLFQRNPMFLIMCSSNIIIFDALLDAI